jgi:hypothetical protein
MIGYIALEKAGDLIEYEERARGVLCPVLLFAISLSSCAAHAYAFIARFPSVDQ